jgi:hypothetical protein
MLDVPFKETTDIPYYDAFLRDPSYAQSKGYIFKIVQMSPDSYIWESARMQGTTMERQKEMVQEDKLKEYAGMMKAGTKFDMPMLDWKRKEQEGRARALAAKSLGFSRIPVLVLSPLETNTGVQVPDIVSRITGLKEVPEETKTRIRSLLSKLPPEINPKINRIIITDRMITKFGEPGKGYSGEFIFSERIMRLHNNFSDVTFYHETAHAVYPELSEQAVEKLGQQWAEQAKSR